MIGAGLLIQPIAELPVQPLAVLPNQPLVALPANPAQPSSDIPKAIATTTAKLPINHEMTHFPSHPNCIICQQAKQRAAPAFARDPTETERAIVFGEKLQADHVGQLGDETVSVHSDKIALQISDEGTGFKTS
jgi:hypothetical protein